MGSCTKPTELEILAAESCPDLVSLNATARPSSESRSFSINPLAVSEVIESLALGDFEKVKFVQPYIRT